MLLSRGIRVSAGERDGGRADPSRRAEAGKVPPVLGGGGVQSELCALVCSLLSVAWSLPVWPRKALVVCGRRPGTRGLRASRRGLLSPHQRCRGTFLLTGHCFQRNTPGGQLVSWGRVIRAVVLCPGETVLSSGSQGPILVGGKG